MSTAMEVDEKASETTEEKSSITKSVKTIEYPDFNVSSYASKYLSKVKVDRLLHISNVCPSKKKECYRLCAQEVKKGIDVSIYDRVMEEGQKLLGAAECQIDGNWMTSQSQTNEKQVRYLEGIINTHTNTLSFTFNSTQR